MFTTSLQKIVLQKRNLLNFIKYPCLFRFISTDSKSQPNSFTISYLINTCGQSPQRAISISKEFNFESSTKPDSVLTLLRNYGFTDSNISKFVSGTPRLLLASVEKTLKPKFNFFNSKGFSGEEFAEIISKDGRVLSSSLKKTIIPSYDFLKILVGSDENVVAMLKRSLSIVVKTEILEANIAVLRAHGVPEENITKLLISQPRVLGVKKSRFSEIVAEVQKMEFNSSTYLFLLAVHALSSMSTASLKVKFDVYKSWGWSEDELRSAFRTYPYCMTLSQENIMSKMDCFVNKFGYAPSLIAKKPNTLQYSLERIVPRCSVVQLLTKTGQLKHPPSLTTFLPLTDVNFLRKFVIKYEKKVPELMNAYRKKVR